MAHILKIILVIVAITYSLKLINAQSDLLVFSGLAIVGAALYFITTDLTNLLDQIKSKL
ncbi:hypothetical protein [Dyadobacter luticola]|uniref:hypothetical protein n=1 Tax=Dyadobacter luticola TaxID=1979387 RepID=UPI00148612E2|nr:hypothetical protein [Dyadobacter luticola]